MADKRADYAASFASRGDAAEAADLMRQALDLAPDWAIGWRHMAEYAGQAGQRDKAIAALQRMLELEPEDIFGARMQLSLLGVGAAPDVPPSRYVEGLFDDYAERFDDSLVKKLGYAVPVKLAAFIRKHAGVAMPFATLVDLGCGTGLVGAELAGDALALEGYDLSERMLAKAAVKGMYGHLARADLTLEPQNSGLFDGRPRHRADLVVAADVMIYLGDLKAAFKNVAALIREDGAIAFSVERARPDVGLELLPSLRYCHSAGYVTTLLADNGLLPVAIEETVIRMDAGKPLTGLLVLARRAG